MARDEYLVIARVAKAHGKRGEVVTVPVNGLPPLLHADMRVALVPPQLERDRFHTVLDASEGDAGQLVALSGSRSMTDAESLVGSYVLALMDELPEQVELMDDSWLEGREVVDETRGSLGHIVEVLRGPANDAWVIQGPEGELIIPVVEHLLVDVPDEGPILVSARPEDMVRG